MNQLYYGDNLNVLRDHIADESVDLIYLDPPFNSKRDYNLLFKSPKGQSSEAQIEAFEDTWHWNEQAEREYDEIVHGANTDLAQMIQALRSFLGENDMMAYRLLELHRVLKPTGSLYLHCDPTASHYLKIVLDGVFGKENFRNEIIWMRSMAKGLTSRALPNNHDTILCFQKTEEAKWNEDAMFEAYTDDLDEKTDEKYALRDEDGRRYQLTSLINPNANRPNLTYEFLGVTKVWRWTRERMQEAYGKGLVVQTKAGNVPRYKRYLDEQRGKPIADVWLDIPPINAMAQERLGYPTQKPLALLERIIQASSNEGDVVLDPFCGCGTAVHAAQKLNRQWLGIDITHLAISLIEKRLKDAFKTGLEFEIHGTPKDLDAARDLARRDKYQFQWWAVSLVDAQPFQGKKKGADGGIDGLKFFRDLDKKDVHKIVVSVKGGENLKADDIRSLMAVREREDAEIGVFISLEEPTRGMVKDAASAGFYESPNGKKFPRVQLLTIGDLLEGKARAEHPDYEPDLNFKKAKQEEHGKQMMLVSDAIKADLAPLAKRLEAILEIKDNAKMMAELKRLHTEWPEMEAEVRKNKKTAKTFEKIMSEAFLKGLSGAET
jgi:site-specific DNA-methyltransferase (adenine-specific)